MTPYQVVLADDHALFRGGVRRILEEMPGVEIVAEAGDGLALLEILKKISPDLVVLDISMPNLRGLEAIRKIKKLLPETDVLMLTMHNATDYLTEALSAGASGYLLKQEADPELFNAIQTIRSGKTYLSPYLRELVPELLRRRHDPEGSPKEILTHREREVLKLLADGNTSREIAHKLDISLRTVQNHRANIMRKLSVKRTTDLVKYALQKGYV